MSFREIESAARIVLLVGLIGALGFGAWLLTRPPRIVPVAEEAGTVRVAPRLVPNRQAVQVATVVDSSGLQVEQIEVKDATEYVGTISVASDGGAPLVLGVRPARVGLLYEFRSRRLDRVAVDVLPTGGETSQVLYLEQPLPLIQRELKAEVGMGYTGLPAVYIAATGLRITGVHVGGFLGLELDTAELLVGPYVSARVWRTATIGGGWDVVERRPMVGLSVPF